MLFKAKPMANLIKIYSNNLQVYSRNVGNFLFSSDCSDIIYDRRLATEEGFLELSVLKYLKQRCQI